MTSANEDFADAQAALGILLVDQQQLYNEGKEWLERSAQLVSFDFLLYYSFEMNINMYNRSEYYILKKNIG